MTDTPYTERGGGAYVRLKDGRTVPEDSPEGQAALGTTGATENTADPNDGGDASAKPATSRKVK